MEKLIQITSPFLLFVQFRTAHWTEISQSQRNQLCSATLLVLFILKLFGTTMVAVSSFNLILQKTENNRF